jgi:hypothetical protein
VAFTSAAFLVSTNLASTRLGGSGRFTSTRFGSMRFTSATLVAAGLSCRVSGAFATVGTISLRAGSGGLAFTAFLSTLDASTTFTSEAAGRPPFTPSPFTSATLITTGLGTDALSATLASGARSRSASFLPSSSAMTPRAWGAAPRIRRA